MKRFYSALVLVLISLFFVECQKSVDYVGRPDPAVILPEPISTNLQGNILDENDLPAVGVTVKVGVKTAITDSRGYFRIQKAALDKNSSLITAEKTGYFKAYRTFSATSGTNQVVIKLLKKALAGTVSATAGGTITLGNGAKVSLPANGVVQAAGGAAYSGTVNVYATYIDPTATDIAQTVPGSFIANDKDNKRVLLASYGMLAVELESAAGEKLQIKSGSEATLTSPIPSSLQSSAPSTIALWYVEEQTGIWKEEGSATKNGTNYVGRVSHFSFWNCDIGIPAITVSMTLKNAAGLPLVHVPVRIKRVAAGYFSQAYGWTDSLGEVRGLVPSNENLVLDVLDPCDNSIYNQAIGPFAENTNLGVITVTASGSSLVTIKGKLLNCAGSAVTVGYAIINFDNMVRFAAVNATGDFATIVTKCSGSPATAQVVGVDETAQQQGSNTNVTITTPITNAGTISACGVLTTQFINYTLDGTNYSITSTSPGDSLIGHTQLSNGVYKTDLTGYQVGGTNWLNLGFRSAGTSAGSYPLSFITVQNPLDSNIIIQPFNVVITNFPASAGGFYEGNFSGQFRDLLNVTHTVTATFRVRRML